MFSLPLFGAVGYGKLTATADTAIVRTVAGRANAFTRLLALQYTNSTTAHTITVMRPLNVTTLTAAVAAGASYVLPIAADPGDYPTGSRVADNVIAANDYVVIELPDGTLYTDTVASVSSLNVTMNGTLPTGGAASGAKVWFFGITTDTNPCDGLAHPAYNALASVATTIGGLEGDVVAGFIGTVAHPSTFSGMDGKGQPIIVYVNNATAAGTLDRVVAAHSQK